MCKWDYKILDRAYKCFKEIELDLATKAAAARSGLLKKLILAFLTICPFLRFDFIKLSFANSNFSARNWIYGRTCLGSTLDLQSYCGRFLPQSGSDYRCFCNSTTVYYDKSITAISDDSSILIFYVILTSLQKC